MKREFYLDLARSGLRMPIGAHLVLREHADADEILLDGPRLGAVVAAAARRFATPLAFPLMDLTLEKTALLAARSIPAADINAYHFRDAAIDGCATPLIPRMRATCAAIQYLAGRADLLAVGMAIGPFSLATKLVADPITPVFLAGAGATAAEEAEVRLFERVLEVGQDVILEYLRAQIEAGAKAIIICEPAANQVYFSPKQLAQSYAVFERYVLAPNRRVRRLLADAGVDLIFHNCGELFAGMLERFTTLDPAVLSLGSSRVLWEDAARVPKTTVLYGNLPTKRFYSDALLSLAEVRRIKRELSRQMDATGHPFIMGSECDVLSVPECERTIQAKVDEFLNRE
jgi:uroporphyrinogen-III decarboxylase